MITLVDIDGIDELTGTFGPETTDGILEIVGARIRHSIRRGDTLACPGGPHFTLVIDCPGDPDLLCRRLLETVAEPVQTSARSLWVTASIGAAHRPHGHDPTDHFQSAGAALQEATDQGGDCYVVTT